MSEFSGLLDLIAAQQIDERTAHTRHHQMHGVRHLRGRRALARRALSATAKVVQAWVSSGRDAVRPPGDGPTTRTVLRWDQRRSPL